MALLILALLQRIFLMSSLMLLLVWLIFFMVLIKLFFFQAEDGIRDGTVTGVQTCALPIYRRQQFTVGAACRAHMDVHHATVMAAGRHEIGRASCRERMEESAVWLFSYWRYCKGYF